MKVALILFLLGLVGMLILGTLPDFGQFHNVSAPEARLPVPCLSPELSPTPFFIEGNKFVTAAPHVSEVPCIPISEE